MKSILIIALTLSTIFINAQNDLVRYRPCTSGCGSNLNESFTYGAITTFGTPDVISDYGVRKTDRTRFHQAIDYTVQGVEDKGYALSTVKKGTISNIVGDETYKSITVGNNTYTHIFVDAVPEIGKFIKSGKFLRPPDRYSPAF